MFKSLRSKIAFLAALPLLVALYFMGSAIVVKYGTLGEMDQIGEMAKLAEHISALVHETQKERGATGVFMGSGGKKFVSQLTEQRKLTDSRRTALKDFLDTFDSDSFGQQFNQTLSAALDNMSQIDNYRSKVSSLAIPTKEALGLYTKHNAGMLDVVQCVSGLCSNADMARVSSAYLNFLQGKERAGIERAVLSSTFARDMFAPGALRWFGSLVAAQDTYFSAFRAQAPPEQVAFFNAKMSSPVVTEVQQMRDIAFAKGEVKTEGFGVDSAHWFASMTKKINLMKTVEDRLAADLRDAVGSEAGGLQSLLQLCTDISALVHETQKERGLTAGFYGSGGTKFVSELAEQRKLTDGKKDQLDQRLASLAKDEWSKAFVQALDRATAKLNGVRNHRSKVSAQTIPAKEAIGFYTKHNSLMLDTISTAAQSTDNASIRSGMIAYVSFLQGKERAGIERAVMSKTFAADKFESGVLRKFGSLVTAQETYLDVFRSQATPQQVAFFDQTLSDPIVAEVQSMRDVAFEIGVVNADGFGVEAGTWFATMTKKINLMKEVDDRLSADLTASATEMRASAQSALITLGGVVLAVVIGVLVAVYFIVRSIVGPINRIIAALNEGADQVNDAANQVSSASQTSAEGASEQASSLEETSSALEQMAAMTRTNAENAKQANELSGQAKAAAQSGDKTMRQLNEAMTGINESSGKISKIIKVIEEIAFQTNLLALNAAVEAARAGEHGKGFAVVADEVRNLAQRAAQASKEITVLIDDSVTKAKEGTAVAEEVGNALTAIVGDVAKVSDLVNGITKASEEQAQGVEQVNTAVSQMDKVTQQNAAGAEESAAAAEELAAQAQSVKGTVNSLNAIVSGNSSNGSALSDVHDSGKNAPKAKHAHNIEADPVTKGLRAASKNRPLPAGVGQAAAKDGACEDFMSSNKDELKAF